jgi:SH3 domain protein
MKFSFRFILINLIFLTAASSAFAETRYVSDQLVITVRSNKEKTYNILETLITATPVKILEEDKTYAKVITPKGTKGFVLKQYISKKIPKSIQIEQLKKETAKLKKEIAALQHQLTKQQQDSQKNLAAANVSQAKTDEISAQLSQTRQELKKVNNEYQTLLKNSENIVNLAAENEQLIEQNNVINSEMLILREENQSFHRSNMIQWFLAGGGVFFGGWLVGKISRKKSSGYSRL